MEEIALPIVITGHIDHGKSTLIGRLLYDTGVLKEDRYQEILATSSGLGKVTEFAFVLDALEEERERGITIDTTQIYFQTAKRKYVIIDAPGHREFLRNMITGASYAEAAVLIIDANEGIMEQTKRHAYLLSMVGIRDVCVLVNKMDLVGFSKEIYDRVVSDIKAFFTPLFIEPKYFIPMSALSGINVATRDPSVEWYDGPCLFEALDGLDFKAFDERPLRFPVQDVYVTDGERLVAGRIESGEVVKGMEVYLLPEGKACKIGEVRKYMAEGLTKAVYGDSVGLIVEGNDPAADCGAIKRGDILSGTNDSKITTSIHANLFWFYDTYRQTDKMKIRCATQEAPCAITIHEKFDPATMDRKTEGLDRLEVGEIARVTITTERPIVIDAFSYIPEMGRFIIEKDGVPVGGGIVT